MLSNLSPSEPAGRKLCEIFPYHWLAIAGTTTDKTDPNWETIGSGPNGKAKFPLKPRTLWRMWQDYNRLVGVRFGNYTTYCMLDIDRGSQFHSADGLDTLREALETIGIVRTITLRSSFNGGIHLYCPLPYEVPTFDLATAIKYALEAQEIYLEPGQLESFPNVKSFGRSWLKEFTQYNAHRLPLQPGSGSVLLNYNYQPDGAELEKFFFMWEFATQQQDDELLNEALKQGRDQHRKRKKISHHPAELWREDLEYTIEQGWTGRGQTNQLLKEIACYGRVFQQLEGYELGEFVERIAVTRAGYLDYCDHQHQIQNKCRAWARAAEKYYYPIGSKPPHRTLTFDYNAERAKEAASRISKAVIELATTGNLPECVRERARKLAQIGHTSIATLYKNLALWHPNEWCVTAEPASDTSNSAPSAAPPLKRLELPSFKPLHTPTPLMKGEAYENPLLKFCDPDSGGQRGGSGERRGFPQADKGV